MILNSLSDKRIIIKSFFGDIEAYLLVDTGASVGLVNKNDEDVLQLIRGKKYHAPLVGAGGEMKAWYCNTLAKVGGKQVGQFLIADIDAVVRSIERETGVTISGILSLPQMAMIGATIDTMNKSIIIN